MRARLMSLTSVFAFFRDIGATSTYNHFQFFILSSKNYRKIVKISIIFVLLTLGKEATSIPVLRASF